MKVKLKAYLLMTPAFIWFCYVLFQIPELFYGLAVSVVFAMFVAGGTMFINEDKK